MMLNLRTRCHDHCDNFVFLLISSLACDIGERKDTLPGCMLTCVSDRANAGVHVDQVVARGVVLTGVSGTIIDVRFASVAFKSRFTFTASRDKKSTDDLKLSFAEFGTVDCPLLLTIFNV